jgi:oxygen-independent coproporphyrinogen III oxidase
MANAATVSRQVLERYDRSGPRYTSYPTAVSFTPEFRETQFRAFANACSRQHQSAPLSLYVHVPFCASPCFYCGCNRTITRDYERGDAYVRHLLQEIELVSPLFMHRKALQLHFGGGTPNFLRPGQLGLLLNAMRDHFGLGADSHDEVSIEIDPRFIAAEDLAQLARQGFNRVSLGVQDFDEGVQQAVNRIQSVEQTLRAITACRAAGIESINIDLMDGLPRQTLEGFRRTLQTVIGSRPSRLAIYGYAHMPQLFKAQRRINSEELPDADTRIALLSLAIEMLTGAGYRYIGMDHFALPRDELATAQDAGRLQRNFMGYTTHAGCDLLGFGVSAISHIGNSYSQNPRDLAAWESSIDAGRLPVWRGLALDADDVLRAEIISQIMCQGDVDVSALEERHGIDFWSYFAAERRRLLQLESDGLVWVCASRIIATSQGRYLLRLLAACFDRYLHRESAEPQAPRFSKMF